MSVHNITIINTSTGSNDYEYFLFTKTVHHILIGYSFTVSNHFTNYINTSVILVLYSTGVLNTFLLTKRKARLFVYTGQSGNKLSDYVMVLRFIFIR